MDRFIVNETKLDDRTIMEMLALHQGDALSDLYDRYGRLVYSIALNSIGDQAVAEEIVQDVFLQVWENAYMYDARISKVSTWLSNIARHRAIDELRRRKIRPERNSIDWADMEGDQEQVAEETPGPEDEAELSWQHMNVREAIHALSPEQREVLALAYFKGYSQSKIAEVLNIPLGTVKTRLRMAMQKLRLLFNQTLQVE